MTHLRTAIVVVILGLFVGHSIYSDVATAERQDRLQNTITDQRAIICNLATGLFDLSAEVHPVLAVVNPRVGAPIPPKPTPPPVTCASRTKR